MEIKTEEVVEVRAKSKHQNEVRKSLETKFDIRNEYTDRGYSFFQLGGNHDPFDVTVYLNKEGFSMPEGITNITDAYHVVLSEKEEE